MPDFPDFSSPIWDRRDVKAKDVELKYTVFVPEVDIEPGAWGYATIYTVPAGRRYFASDCYGATTFTGSLFVYVAGSHDIYTAFFEPYDTHSASLALPIPAETGEEIRIFWENKDIVPGTFRILLGIWWEPGSKWTPPKGDDLLTRFKAGDWNFAQYFLRPDGSYSVIFRQTKEGKSNFLSLQKPYQPTEKKLASMHLNNKEAQEIMDTIHSSPKKVKSILKKYEDKYKLRALKFAD